MYILHMSDGNLENDIVYDECPEDYVIEDVVRDWYLLKHRSVGGSFDIFWDVRYKGQLFIEGNFLIDISPKGV